MTIIGENIFQKEYEMIKNDGKPLTERYYVLKDKDNFVS